MWSHSGVAGTSITSKNALAKPTKVVFWLIIVHAELIILNSMWDEENTVQSNIKIPFCSSIIHFNLYYLIQLKVKSYTMV